MESNNIIRFAVFAIAALEALQIEHALYKKIPTVFRVKEKEQEEKEIATNISTCFLGAIPAFTAGLCTLNIFERQPEIVLTGIFAVTSIHFINNFEKDDKKIHDGATPN